VRLKELLGVWGLKWKLWECKDVLTWRERVRFLSERLVEVKRRVMRCGELVKRRWWWWWWWVVRDIIVSYFDSVTVVFWFYWDWFGFC
jgi:hypothetical protein